MKSQRFLILFFSAVVISFVFSTANLAQLDPTFGTGGVVQTNILAIDLPHTSFSLPGGKILIVNGSQRSFSLVRFNSNGSLDTTYGTNGVIPLNLPFNGTDPNFSTVLGIIRQPDGKLLFFGKDINDAIIIRVNEDGSLDSSFGSSGVHRPNIDQLGMDELHGAALQPDGKIVAVGRTTSLMGTTRLFLIRYETNGTLDPNFGDGGFIIHNIRFSNRKVLLQSNGKILACGLDILTFTATIYRFNPDGSFDAGFTPVNFNHDLTRDLILQPDDKILLSEYFQENDTLERTHYNLRVSRFNADGTIDGGFGAGGGAKVDVAGFFDDYSGELGLLPDGQIIAVAVVNVTGNRRMPIGHKYALVRLSASGTLNGKFLIGGVNPSPPPQILILPEGKILGITSIPLPNNNSDLLMMQVTGVPLQNYKFRGVPYDFGLINDSRADVSVFRQTQQNWYINPLSNPFNFGLPGDIPIPADFIMDYGSELAVFRPSTGLWYIARDFFNPGQNFIAVPWGRTGDIPIPFDFDGDSKSDIAVFRPSEGNWYIRNSHDNSATILHWGTDGDKPVPGDYDGDGIDDIAVWRPSNGVWYILKSSDAQPMFVRFGLDGDVPVQEDYDGDGRTDVAVWRPSNGVWYILKSSDGGFSFYQWGLPTDIPVPADYDGDLKIDIAVWRPSNRTWYLIRSGTNSSEIFPFGTAGDLPVQGRY